jgi:ribonuclease P protein component
VALRSTGRRGRSDGITATWIPSTATGQTHRHQLALAVGRNVGGAVDRNRLRRRLRSSFGALAHEVVAGTFLLGAGPSAADLGFVELHAHVDMALQRAGAR